MATRLLHALFIGAGIAAGTALAQGAGYDLDLPPGALATSLEALARQTGLQLLFDPRLLDGRQSGALKGRMSAREALDRLLAGSGLSVVATGEGAFALRPAPKRSGAETEHRLGEIVVAATRTANPLAKVPASLSLVSLEDFEAAQATNVADVLKKVPNVEFGGGPRMDGEIPSIRGYSGKGVTLLMDGARQNWLNNTLRNPLYVDPYFLSTVEILRGSASSLYGPGGLGGAMAFRTISPGDFLTPEQSFGGGVKFGHATADRSNHLNARVYGQGEAFDALVAVGQHDWGTRIRQGGGTELDPNDGGASSGLLKLGLNSEKLRYELSRQEFRRDNRENSNPQADSSLPGAASVQMFHTRHDQTVLRAATNERFSGPQLSASVYETDLNITAEQGASAALAPYTMMRTKTTGAGLQGGMAFGDAAFQQRATTGLDYYKDEQTSLSGAAANAVIPDGEQEVVGVYLQDEISIGGQWSVTPSLRYDRYDTTPTIGSGRSASHTSPKIAVAWKASDAWLAYASFGESFRAPNVNELYWSLSGTFAYSNFRANPELKPETDETFELGAKYSARGVLSEGDKAKVRIAFFDAKAKDMITSVVVGSYTRTSPIGGTGSVFQYQNVSEAKRRGTEFEAGYSVGNAAIDTAYSRIRVTDESNGSGLFSPPDKLVLRLSYVIPQAGLDISWATTGVGAQDYDGTALRRRSGYSVHDLYASWKVAPGGRKLRLDVGMTNLSDKRYLVYQSSNTSAFTYQEGRSLKVALGADF